MLAGADQVQVLTLDLVHHGVHVRLAHHALHHVAVDHKRRNAVGEALVDHKVTAIGCDGGVQPRDVAHQVIEAVAGYTGGSVHIHAVEALHDLRVVGDGEVRGLGLAEALHLYVAAVVRTDGHRLVDHLGDDQQQLVHGRLGVGLLLLQTGHALGVGLYGGVVGVDLRLKGGLLRLVGALFQPAEQGAVGLG